MLLAVVAGALLAWAVVPSGAAGQQYPLPTVPQPPAESTPLPLLTPFPIIRIVGRTTPRGARISRLTARAVVGATVVSRCVGATRRCPYRQRVSLIAGRPGQVRTVHVRAFERSFRAGVLLRVYVLGAGRTGKFTSFRIRRGRSPRRNDGCVSGVVLRPATCPGG